MEEEFSIEYSDDESPIKTGYYEPPPETIEKLYELLNEGKLPELKWECPGYRPPTPKDLPKTPTKEENIEDEKSDFDFMDEMNAPKLKVRREGDSALKGSAKKKTTSLDGILSNMRRHWKLDQQQLSDKNQTPQKSSSENIPAPTTPTTTSPAPVTSSS